MLVVCPASLKINWQRELRRWLVRPFNIAIAKSEFPASEIVIINYERLGKWPGKLRKNFDLLIVDECHYVKNPKAARSRYVYDIRAKRRLFLTGTPILNCPIEIQPVAALLAPDEFGHFWKFARRYCQTPGDTTRRPNFKGANNLEELQWRLRSTIMVRRLKADVLPQLPVKRRQVIELPAELCRTAIASEKDAWSRHETNIKALSDRVELAKASESKQEYRMAVENLREGIGVFFTEIAAVRHQTAMSGQ